MAARHRLKIFYDIVYATF